MSLIVRQSTARTCMVGPVLDADGVAVTDCVVADFEGSVNGGDPAALNGSATLTHRGVGFYSLALTATDLATVGSFEVTINDTVNACPMKVIMVIEEAVYDALFVASATGMLPANVTQWLGSAAATPTVAGVPEVDVTHWIGTAAATPTVAGVPEVDVTHWLGTAAQGASGRPQVDVELIEGADPTDTIRDAVVDDATRIDASALNTLSGHDPGETIMGTTDQDAAFGTVTTELAKVPKSDSTVGWNATARAQIQQEAEDALAAVGVTTTRTGYLDNLSAGAVALASSLTTLAGKFTGITLVAEWLGLIAGKQTGNSTARTELRATGAGSGTFDETTDSQEALRDRGDAAWTTATGFSTLSQADVRTAVGLASANLDTQLDALPTNSELATALGTADDATLAAIAAVDAKVGTPSNLGGGATLAANLSDIEGQTDDIGSAGAGLTALASAANLATAATYIDTEVAAIKVVTDALTSAGAAKLAASTPGIITGTVDDTGFSPTTTIFEADDITEATADHYNGRIVTFTSGAMLGQSTDITDYALSSGRGRFTVTALTEAPANNVTFVIT